MTEKRKILFIVEGKKAEPVLLKKLNKLTGFIDYDIYTYNTAIYELYEELNRDHYLDIVSLLKEGANPKQTKILQNRYTSIYLVFDFDPQHQKFCKDKLKEMISFFSDPTDGGKLYINYPMIESHRHLKTMPDEKFLFLSVSKSGIKKYKEIVGDYTAYADINAYDYDTIRQMVAHHLVKYMYLTAKENRLPTREEFDKITCEKESDVKLMILQSDLFEKDRLQVLNTALFYFVDLKPKSFFNTKLKNFKI